MTSSANPGGHILPPCLFFSFKTHTHTKAHVLTVTSLYWLLISEEGEGGKYIINNNRRKVFFFPHTHVCKQNSSGARQIQNFQIVRNLIIFFLSDQNSRRIEFGSNKTMPGRKRRKNKKKINGRPDRKQSWTTQPKS